MGAMVILMIFRSPHFDVYLGRKLEVEWVIRKKRSVDTLERESTQANVTKNVARLDV